MGLRHAAFPEADQSEREDSRQAARSLPRCTFGREAPAIHTPAPLQVPQVSSRACVDRGCFSNEDAEDDDAEDDNEDLLDMLMMRFCWIICG